MILRQGATLLLVLFTLVGGCKGGSSSASPPTQAPQPTVVFPDGWTVQVRLALTPEEQGRGLMFVHDLPQDEGMLFLFDTDEKRPFWMKDCFLSLDLIWLDADYRVVDISHNVPPCREDPCPSYYPSRAIRNVLEVQGGLCDTHHLAIGDGLVVVGLPPRGGASSPS
jgi:uncharacterized membrane protein (UPF0127 family)